MKTQMQIIRNTRRFLLTVLEDLSTEQLNYIPKGFKNNIIWNVGHMVAAQQGVCYVRGGLVPVIKEEIFQRFKPDTVPADDLNKEEVTELKDLLLSTIDTLEEDYHNEVFAHVKPWTSRYGVEMKNIEDTIRFLLFHDGLHIGYIMSMKHTLP